jgi:hypothetical protein
MTYFHLTHAGHLPSILAERVLRTTESNVSLVRTHAGPDVVWLFDQAEPDFGDEHDHGLYVAKREIRVQVDVRAIRWLDWAWSARMDPDDHKTLIKAGGGLERAEHWYVLPAPIPSRRWVSITNTNTDTRVEY